MREFIDYVSRFNPGFSQAIVGATSPDIARLEQLAGVALPRSYRVFLEAMGRGIGNLKVYSADLAIHRAIEFYEEGEGIPPSRYLYIAEDTEMDYEDYFLDLESGDRDNPIVVRFATDFPFRPDLLRISFQSLNDMLFTAVFRYLRMPLLKHQRTFLPSSKVNWSDPNREPDMQLLDKVALGRGFQRLPYTGRWSPSYEKDAAMCLGDQVELRGGFAVWLAMDDGQEFRQMTALLEEHVGVVPS